MNTTHCCLINPSMASDYTHISLPFCVKKLTNRLQYHLFAHFSCSFFPFFHMCGVCVYVFGCTSLINITHTIVTANDHKTTLLCVSAVTRLEIGQIILLLHILCVCVCCMFYINYLFISLSPKILIYIISDI
jgi:hypothetical protein